MRLHTSTTWCLSCSSDSLSTITTVCFVSHTITLIVEDEEWIWPQWSPFLSVRSVEWRQTIYGFKWKVCLRVIACYKSSSICWPWSSLGCHIMTCKQNGAGKSKVQPSWTLLLTTPWASKNKGLLKQSILECVMGYLYLGLDHTETTSCIVVVGPSN